MKKLFLTLAVAVVTSSLSSVSLLAAGGGDVVLRQEDWSFSGPFGTFDKASMQRGFIPATCVLEISWSTLKEMTPPSGLLILIA